HAAVGRDPRLVRFVRRVHRIDPVEDLFLRLRGRSLFHRGTSDQDDAEGDRQENGQNPREFRFHGDHLIEVIAPDGAPASAGLGAPAVIEVPAEGIDGPAAMAVGSRLASSTATRHFAASSSRARYAARSPYRALSASSTVMNGTFPAV